MWIGVTVKFYFLKNNSVNFEKIKRYNILNKQKIRFTKTDTKSVRLLRPVVESNTTGGFFYRNVYIKKNRKWTFE